MSRGGEPGRGPGPNHDSVLKGTTTQAGQGVWASRLGWDGQQVCQSVYGQEKQSDQIMHAPRGFIIQGGHI